MPQGKNYVLSLPGRVLVELPRPSALRKRLVHFPFEIIIWDTKVFYNSRLGPYLVVIFVQLEKQSATLFFQAAGLNSNFRSF
jgi:hypothetical protein